MLSARQVLLHRVSQERGVVFHAVAFMPDEELARANAVGQWSVKDVLAHLAAWEAEMTRWIEQFAQGERPTMDIHDCDAWNATEASARRSWTVAEVKDELVQTRQRLYDVVASLPDAAFERIGPPPMKKPFVPAMLNGIADHDREHWSLLMAYKEAWVARQRQASGG